MFHAKVRGESLIKSWETTILLTYILQTALMLLCCFEKKELT